MSFLFVEPPEGAPFRVPLDRPKHCIGRATDNDIYIPDLSLSRHHAEVVRNGTAYYVQDCRSQNGTRLNDELIAAPQPLGEGDRISVGRSRLTYRSGTGGDTTTVVVGDISEQDTVNPDQTIAGTLTAHDLLPSLSTTLQQSDTTAVPQSANDAQLLREMRYLSTFNRVSLELVAHRDDPSELFGVILQLLLEAVAAQRGVLLLLEGTPPELTVKYTKRNEGDDDVGIGDDGEIHLSKTVLNRVVTTKTACLTGKVQKDFQTLVGLNLKERSVMCVPLWNNTEVIGVLYVDSLSMDKVFETEDLRVLTALGNLVAVKIENSRLTEMSLEKLRLDKEMALASEIQVGLQPMEIPAPPGWEIACHQQTSRSVGGDYFDFYSRPGWLDASIGDVAGKGMAAALLMSHAQAVLRTLLEAGFPPTEAIARLNKSVCERSTQGKFITMVLARIELATGRIDYRNAGHCNPVILKADGRLGELQEGGLVLGVDPDEVYPVGVAALEPGDVFFLYTDGATDVKNARGERLGENMLLKTVAYCRGRSARQIEEAVLALIGDFSGGERLPDDVTFVVVRRLPPIPTTPTPAVAGRVTRRYDR